MQDSTPQPQHALWFDHLRVTALTATMLALVITIFIEPLGIGAELNPFAVAAVTELGWTTVGVAAVIAVAGIFALYRRMLPHYPRVTLAAAGSVTALSLADLLANVAVLLYAGVPTVIWWGKYGPRALAVIAATGVVLSAPYAIQRFRPYITQLQTRAPSVPVRGRQLAAVFFGVLVTVSIIGPGVVMLPGFDSDHAGTAAASEGTLTQDDSASLHGSNNVEGLEIDNEGFVYSSSDGGVYKKSHATNLSEDASYSGSISVAYDMAYDEGYIYTAGFDGSTHYLLKLDASDMSLADSTSVSNGGSGGVEVTDSYVYYGHQNGKVSKRSKSDLSQVDSVSVGSSNIKELGYGDGDVFAASQNGKIYRVQVSDMSQQATWDSGETSMTSVEYNSKNGYVYAGGGGGILHQLNPSDLSVADNTSFANAVNSMEVGPDNHVYASGACGSSCEEFFVFDADSLTQHDKISTSNKIYDSEYTQNEQLFMGEQNSGTVYNYSTGTSITALSGQVTDSNGDSVANATVVVKYNDTNPPSFDTSNLEQVMDDPTTTMDGYNQFLDDFNVDDIEDLSRSDWQNQWDTGDSRVVPYQGKHWGVNTHTVDVYNPFVPVQKIGEQQIEVQDVTPSRPTPVHAPGEEVVLVCYEGEGLLYRTDYIDRGMPGVTTPCTMTVEKLDELGNAEWSVDRESGTIVSNRAPQNAGLGSLTGVKDHHGVVMQPTEPGVYRASPADSDVETYFVVAPDSDEDKLFKRIENWGSDRHDAITDAEQEYETAWSNAPTERTTTNETGHYTLNPPANADTADVAAFKAGEEIDYDPLDQTRQDIENEIESSIRGNFRAETAAVDFDDSATHYHAGSDDTFERVCERMDSVADDVGAPYHGQKEGIDIDNGDFDIEGNRIMTEGIGPNEQLCAAMNLAQQIVDDGLAGLFPGMQDDISGLSRAELEDRYRQLMAFIEGTPGLERQLDERTDGDIDTILNDDPADLSRSELEARVSDGMDVVESGGTTGGGGGGGGVGGVGGGAPTVSPPDSSTGNETLDAVWQVGGVDNWDDASLLVRLHYSNGSTAMLNASSDHVTIDESVVGSDSVRLEEYPLGETDPATVRAELDVSTPDGSTGSPDTGDGVVRNPTFDGEIPGLRNLKVSKFAPGPSDNLTVDVAPREDSRFGELKYANVSHTDCDYGQTPEDGEIDLWTCGEGTHHVQVTFSNPGGTEFTEVVKVEARPASQSRPASIRANVGPVGRYAVVNGKLRGGDIQTQDGASVVEVIAIAEPGDIPNSIAASTTGMDVAQDSDTVVRVTEGDAQQTVRRRVGVILHRDSPSGDALLYRNGDAIPKEGETAAARLNMSDGKLTVDSFTNEEGEMQVRVNGDPSIIERVRHWVSLNVPFPSLSVGGDLLLFMAPFVVWRRKRKRPPNGGSNGGEAAA